MIFINWLSDIFKSIDGFFFKPSTPHILAMIRLLAGSAIFYIHLTYTPTLMEYVGPEGWIQHDIMDMLRTTTVFEPPGARWDGTDRPINPPRGSSSYSIFFNVTDPAGIWAMHGIFLTANLLFAMGLFTRFTGVLTWIGALSYIQRAQTSLFGMDTIISILLFYLMLSPCGKVWSVDRFLEKCRARRADLPVEPVAASSEATFFQRAMQIHFAIIYLGAGTSKLMGAAWWQGVALWGCLANYSFAPMQYDMYMNGLELLVKNRWIWEIFMSSMAVFTLFLELGFPFAVWVPKARWPFMLGAIVFHTGIGLLMGLRLFSFLMCTLVLSFATPEDIRSIVSWLGGLFGLGRHGAAAPDGGDTQQDGGM